MMMKSFLCFLLFLPSIFPAVKSNEDPDGKTFTKTIYATYYAKKFEGRRTSSGVRYRAKKMTAAHRTLPFGTEVKVTNISNGQSVTVKVNDRGPFSKKYSLDLSEAAAKEIGIYRKGSALVEITYTLE